MDDLKKLCQSPFLSRGSPHGFQPRLIFDLALVTAMRSSALWTLTLRQVKKIEVEGETVWNVAGVIGSRIDASTTNPGGWNAVRDRPSEVCVWNKDLLDGSLNVYQDISDYMDIRVTKNVASDRFFLALNPHGKAREDFFKCQNLGRNSFSKIVKTVCETAGVTGSGFKDGMTIHGLRGTVVTRLFESGFSDATVAIRTGHRDLRSLKSYHNLRGNLGRSQQESLFGLPSKRAKGEVEGAVKDEKENV